MTTTRRTIVGIDLGTTYSLVGTVQGKAPLVLPNGLGELLTPSAVSVDDDGRLLVGAAARARAQTHPELTVLAFKRDMGTDRKYRLGGREMTPEELSALVLRELKADAEQALGVEIEEAVITVPAYFGDRQRQATRDAGRIAGLDVERIINEPTAAALAYGLHERDRELRAVVLDLGGGTFDVTVLEILEGVIEIQSSAGDSRLGGEDFADLVAADVERRIVEQHRLDGPLGRVARARVREASEQAKLRLSGADETTVVLPALDLGGGRSVDFSTALSRVDAEALWAPLLERVRAPILRALRDAGVRPDRVDEVLMVGGATRMPCVVRLAASLFGRMPHRRLPADEAVAMGAAVQAALKAGDEAVEDMVATDVAPFTLGIATSVLSGSRLVEGVFAPILERGTVIPASRVERFRTVEDGQRRILVEVYQGEHSLVRDNTKLGHYEVKDLPAAPAGEQAVDVRFTYDLNGILEVEMTVVETRQVDHLVLEQRPGRMSAADIEAARKRMRALKIHPRDTLPNRTALARAEALYPELRGPARDHLGAALASFRLALEEQEPARIEEQRGLLNRLLEMLRRG